MKEGKKKEEHPDLQLSTLKTRGKGPTSYTAGTVQHFQALLIEG
jgi:hypothetical protein